MRIRRARLAALLAVPALLLAGCGDSGDDTEGTTDETNTVGSPGSDEGGPGENPFTGQPPEEVINAAARETQQLDTFHLEMDDPTAAFSMDLRMSNDGRCSGTIADGPKEQEIRSDGTDVYAKGNRAFWESTSTGGIEMGRAVDELLDGKWLRLSRPDDIRATRELCSPSTIMPSFQVPGERFTEEGEPITLDDGDAAVQFTSPSAGTVAISVEEPHVIRQLEVPERGGTTISEVNEELEVEAPAPREVVDQPEP